MPNNGAHGIINFIVRVTEGTGLAYITQIESVAACVAWAINEFIGLVYWYFIRMWKFLLMVWRKGVVEGEK